MTRSIIDTIMLEDYPLNYAFDFDSENPKNGVWLAGNGLYEYKTLPHFGMLYQTASFNTRAGSGSLTPFLNPIPEMPRVPIKIVATIFAFFREVYDKAKTEVQINVYWNRNHLPVPNVPGIKDWGDDIITYVPKQTVSAARTTFESNDETYLFLVKNMVILLDTHSHHDMQAFMSGTDQDSSNIPAVYFDFGQITSKNAQIFAWAAEDDQHIFEDLPLSELYKFMEPLPQPVAEPVVPVAPVNQTKYVNGKFVTAPATTYAARTIARSNKHLFSSEALLTLAESVPKDWHEQVIYPKPVGFGRRAYSDLMTLGLQSPEPTYPLYGTPGSSYAKGITNRNFANTYADNYPDLVDYGYASSANENYQFEDALDEALEFTSSNRMSALLIKWALGTFDVIGVPSDATRASVLNEIQYAANDYTGANYGYSVVAALSPLSNDYIFADQLYSNEKFQISDFTDDEFSILTKLSELGDAADYDVLVVSEIADIFNIDVDEVQTFIINNQLKILGDVSFLQHYSQLEGFRELKHVLFEDYEVRVFANSEFIERVKNQLDIK